MRVLSTGMKWEDLEIKKDQKGFPEIHYTSVFRAFQGWVNDGIFDKIFEASVMKLFQEKLVDCTILHGDGTNHAAKKGGDNLGFNAHKRIKGDKVVVVCDRNVNVIASFIEAPGNRNEAILLNPCGVVAQKYFGIGSPIFLAFYLILTESDIPNRVIWFSI